MIIIEEECPKIPRRGWADMIRKSHRRTAPDTADAVRTFQITHPFHPFSYESRFEKEYGFLRPIIKEVVERYFDCGNPRCGFARIHFTRCRAEHLLMFSCKTRGFCPSCHAKRLEEWGDWMRETLLLDVPHRQVVFTVPKMLRLFFKFKRRLLGDLCRCAVRALLFYFQAAAGIILEPGVVAIIQTFGDRINFHPHLHFLVTECLYAKTFRDAGAADIGYAWSCHGDFAWAKAYNPKLRLMRDMTLMNGDEYCNPRRVWEG